jgi:hypothetical protein
MEKDIRPDVHCGYGFPCQTWAMLDSAHDLKKKKSVTSALNRSNMSPFTCMKHLEVIVVFQGRNGQVFTLHERASLRGNVVP